MSLEEQIDDIIQTHFRSYAEKCRDTLRREAPRGHTGNLKASIGLRKINKKQYEVYASAPYAGIVVNGRKDIYPINAKSLRYVDYNGDSKSVHHGTPGKVIFTKHSGPSQKNDFVSRALAKLK